MSKTQRRYIAAATSTVALSALIVAWLFASSTSQAQSDLPGHPVADKPPADPPIPPIPPRPQRTRSPFEPYAADPGALTYDSLSDKPIPDIEIDPEAPIDEAIYAIIANETKASVDDAQAWAETHNGHAVSHKWSGYSATMRARAKVKAAEYASGTTGLGDVGVE